MLVGWPVLLVVQHTFADGLDSLRAALSDPSVTSALRLTVFVAVVAVVINTIFGVGISLLLVRYDFRGKRVLSALIDLPLSVSPIVVGLALMLVYGGRSGWFGPALEDAGFQVIFAVPGIIMATVFVVAAAGHPRGGSGARGDRQRPGAGRHGAWAPTRCRRSGASRCRRSSGRWCTASC